MPKSSRSPKAKEPIRVDLPLRGWNFEIYGEHALWANTAKKTGLFLEITLAVFLVIVITVLTSGLGLMVDVGLAILRSMISIAHHAWDFILIDEPWFWVAIGLLDVIAATLFLKAKIGRILTRFEFDRAKQRLIIERRSLHLRFLKPTLQMIQFKYIVDLACEVYGDDAARFRLRVRVPRDYWYTLSLGQALPPALCREQLAWLQPALGARLCIRGAPLIDGRPGAETFRFPPADQPLPEPE